MIIREMDSQDYGQVVKLWQETEGIGLSEADEEVNIQHFIKRNPGMSFVAEALDGKIVGALLCGHDGRRGYLHHLAVDKSFRRKGLGSSLVECCLKKLKTQGIKKCHLFVFCDNPEGFAFWQKKGFYERKELMLLSCDI